MDRVAFQTVLQEAAGLAGFTLSQLTTTPRTQLRTFINRRAREYWNRWWWNQIMHAEERYYRAAYDAATAYATDDEVYYQGAYYRALQSTTGNLPTNATYWGQITADFDAYLELEQTGQRRIGTVRQLSVDNPFQVRAPRITPFRLAGSRIWIVGSTVPSSIYVWYREAAPTWLGDDFSATATYASGDIRYFEGTGSDYTGDFWQCQATTSAGESPITAPVKWERVAFPEWLREPVAQAAYSDFLRQDGSPESATLANAEAERLLLQAIHRDGPAQRQLTRSAGA